METIGDRIKQMLEHRGISQARLARLVGVKQQTISYLCSKARSDTTSGYAPAIAAALGVNSDWLQTGEGDAFAPSIPSASEISAAVPLLSWDEVIDYLEGRKDRSKARMLMTDVKVGDRAFVLEGRNESMAPTLSIGDRIIIDPDVKPMPGDYVCARLGDEVLVRRYRGRTDGFDLVATNPDWPTISCTIESDNIRILGVMVEHRCYRRQ